MQQVTETGTSKRWNTLRIQGEWIGTRFLFHINCYGLSLHIREPIAGHVEMKRFVCPVYSFPVRIHQQTKKMPTMDAHEKIAISEELIEIFISREDGISATSFLLRDCLQKLNSLSKLIRTGTWRRMLVKTTLDLALQTFCITSSTSQLW